MTRLSKENLSKLCAFGSEVAAESARSIYFLTAIESTLSWLNRLTAQLRSDANFSENLIAGIISNKSDKNVIDRNDAITNKLESAQTSINELYEILLSKRKAGRADTQLTDADGIEDAYSNAIAAAADLHNNLNTLRWSICEHDADLSPVSKSYINAENLIKDLLAV